MECNYSSYNNNNNIINNSDNSNSRVSTIVLQLLHNLPINPNVCFLIIASKL